MVLKTTPAERRAIAHGVPVRMAQVLRTAADKHSINYSLVLAVCQHESGFRNVWGHDVGKYREDGLVTLAGVRRYWAAADSRRPNGCGPMQITSIGLQVEAMDRGGLHDQAVSSGVGVDFLAGLISNHGTRKGVQLYNGSGPAAEAYARAVLALADVWHHRFDTK